MELTGLARDVAERFDREKSEIESLARAGREGLDTQTLKSRIAAVADSDGEWQRHWFIAPLTAPERFRATHRALVEALEHERAGLAQQERAIAAVQARHAETPVGRPERDQLEAQAREAVGSGEQIHFNVIELERRLTLTPDSTPLVAAARAGLAVLLPTVIAISAELTLAQLQGLARQVAGAATDLLAAIDAYEKAIAAAERAAGQPLRVPRPTISERRALEAVVRAREIEWSWSETSAGTVGVTTGNPVPKAP